MLADYRATPRRVVDAPARQGASIACPLLFDRQGRLQGRATEQFARYLIEERIMSAEPICGADIVIKALVDQGVDVVFGYPGGAVLPIYDSLFKQNQIG